jgi:DNA-directed RNA polymerase specialized sigma24 family protein
MSDYTYPDHPGAQDTDTSREAAEAIEPVSGRLRRTVHAAIVRAGEHGLTTNECADALGIDKGSIQPRTSELQVLGKIKDSGLRRPNASGKRAIVWRAA